MPECGTARRIAQLVTGKLYRAGASPVVFGSILYRLRLAPAPLVGLRKTMPARVVVVMNEPELAEEAAAALRAQGQDALALADPMTALEALEGAERIEVLVTCLDFAPGKPNGIALGRMARLRRPGIRVLFVGPADLEELADGLGAFMSAPATGPQLVESVLQTLDAELQESSASACNAPPSAERHDRPPAT
jgi:DNA-binding NtrC family response regulator